MKSTLMVGSIDVILLKIFLYIYYYDVSFIGRLFVAPSPTSPFHMQINANQVSICQ